MAKATKTTEKTTAAAPKARATKTEAGPAFNPRANKTAQVMARKAGEAKTTPHTVLAGKSVRQDGLRAMAGETVHLNAADSERLIAKGVVAQGKVEVDTTDQAQAAADQAADQAEAQRLADEQAAADKEARDLAAGKLSGAENR